MSINEGDRGALSSRGGQSAEQLRSGIEISYARSRIESELLPLTEDLNALSTKLKIDSDERDELLDMLAPSAGLSPNLLRSGMQIDDHIAMRNALDYTLGGIPNRFYAGLQVYVAPSYRSGEVDVLPKDIPVRPAEDVVEAKETVETAVRKASTLDRVNYQSQLHLLHTNNSPAVTGISNLIVVRHLEASRDGLDFVLDAKGSNQENPVAKLIRTRR